jgi:hypothetical protein
MAKIKIGNKEFDIEKFNLNDIIAIEEKVGDMQQLGKKGTIGENVKDIRFVIWYALKKHEKNITEEQVGEMIPVSDFANILQDFFKAVDIQANPIAAPKK